MRRASFTRSVGLAAVAAIASVGVSVGGGEFSGAGSESSQIAPEQTAQSKPTQQRTIQNPEPAAARNLNTGRYYRSGLTAHQPMRRSLYTYHDSARGINRSRRV